MNRSNVQKNTSRILVLSYTIPPPFDVIPPDKDMKYIELILIVTLNSKVVQ